MKVTTSESGFSSRPIDLARLQKAWDIVVQRHDLLRAIFVLDFPGNDLIYQVILSNACPSIEIRYDSIESVVTQSLLSRDSPSYTSSNLQHQLAIHVLSDYEARLTLEINHAIVDGHSTKLLAQDLQRAYRGDATPAVPSYAGFVSFVGNQSRDEGIHYWTGLLEGAELCNFPDLSASSPSEDDENGTNIFVPNLDTARIRKFCKDQEITSATMIQLAWAIVLRWYTRSLDTLLGILCSGLDLPIDDVDGIFGPLIGMLTCRFTFDETSVAEVLHDLHTRYLEGLLYQTVSLAEVYDALNLGTNGLFNSVISFEKDDSLDQEKSQPGKQEVNQDFVDGQKSHVEIGFWRESQATSGDFSTYPLTVAYQVSNTGSLHLGCYLDLRILPQWRADRILE
ncbi:condensation domain-containing protein [Fusarium redolens]|uniref:Condensation domain-containing protein n=1 Tax=Fusarium redolens TaxID=48865 RepID=A0A9P9KSV9_FUSRE|nr:condensation domain-containing protein [Fusarium redolens]KAH7267884.1 condensation domain-containing protein [Fusarium redolens]